MLAVAVFLIASHEQQLRNDFYRVLADIQGGVGGGPLQTDHHGLVGRLDELFSLKKGTLQLVGAGLAGLAVIEGVEAVGLWYQRRWAEYLTLIVTTLLIPLEIYELTATVSWFKVVALIVNLAIVDLPAGREAAVRDPRRRTRSSVEDGATRRDGNPSSAPRPRPPPQPRSSAPARAARPSLRTGSPCETRTFSIGRSSSGRRRAARVGHGDSARQVAEPRLRADPQSAARLLP